MEFTEGSDSSDDELMASRGYGKDEGHSETASKAHGKDVSANPKGASVSDGGPTRVVMSESTERMQMLENVASFPGFPSRMLMTDDLTGAQVVAFQRSWVDSDEWKNSGAETDWNAVPNDVKRIVLGKMTLMEFSRLRGVSRAWQQASEQYYGDLIDDVRIRMEISAAKEKAERDLDARRKAERRKCCHLLQ